jgi:photosystem II stability/assembly factor-like uncharacterized protein
MRLHVVFVISVATVCVAAADDGLVQTDNNGCRAIMSAATNADHQPGELGRGANWVPLGPFGGDVEDVSASPIDPNIVLAGIAPDGSSGGTLYRSTDAAATWSEVAALSGTSVFDIEFAPDGTAYIGTQDSVWTSTDDGVSWTQLNLGIGLNDQVFEVAIVPGNPSHIWAGVADAMGNQDKNVLLSTDSGTTWQDRTPVMSPMGCHGIAFDPGNTNNVYACFGGAFGGGAFWYSNDYGITWFNRSSGLPGNPLNDVAHDGARVLVTGGQLFGSQNVGLYESADNGATWNALHDGSWPILALKAIDLDPNNNSIIFLASLGAGAYRSADGGSTWEFGVGGTGGMSLNAVRFSPGSSSVIYLGASSIGVVKSTDGGASFTPSSVGIGALEVVSVEANPNDITEIAISFQALNSGGIYTSTDAGVTWSLEPVPGTRWNDVCFAPDGTLYALNDGPSTIAPEGVYRRNIDGTWACLGPDQGSLFETELFAIRFSQNDPDLIVMGGSDFGVAGHEATVWISSDAGQNWLKAYEGPNSSENVTDIEFVEDGTDTVMVASFDDYDSEEGQTGGALRSSDGGYTWYESSTGLDAEAEGFALCTSPTDPNTFFYADGDYGHGGLFKTTDAGQNWANTGLTGRVHDVVSDPGDDQVLYIMQPSAPVVQKSTDGGASFTPFDSGLGSAGWVRDLAYAAGSPSRLFLSTTTGVYATSLGCAGDLNGDGKTDQADLGILLADWGCDDPVNGCDGDLNGDDKTNQSDLGILLADWGCGT